MTATVTLAHYVGGLRVAADASLLSLNPANTDDVVALVPSDDGSMMEAAAIAAKRAFPAWAAATPEFRSDCLHRVGELLLARAEPLGDLLAREQGKVLTEARGEVVRAGRIFRYFAGEAIRRHGQNPDSVRPGVDVATRREAVGTFALITPWNFPLSIPAWKAAPALAFGNTVVLKPAAPTPAIASALADMIDEAGIPPGVFNLVFGPGAMTSKLIDHPAIDGVSFTGSTPVGRGIASQAAARMIRAQMEMGGKNAILILDDADLDVAVRCALDGAFFGTGQRCTASSRLIVTDGILEGFVDALARAASALRVGDPRHPGTQLGPVATQGQLETVLRYIDLAREEGAVVRAGGGPVARDTPGYFVAPTLLVDCGHEMRSTREEIFGPVASVVRAHDYEHGLQLLNDTEFGLSAGIVTQSLGRARDFQRNARAGMVMVNLPTAGVDYHVPFGGTKASSYGPREQGFAAIDFYTSTKTLYTA